MFLAAAAALVMAAPAAAQIAVDGTRDAAYGAVKSNVTYVPGSPNSNFAAPTPFTDYIGYSISLASDANNVYGFFQANPTGVPTESNVGAFANLYFDINPPAMDGSDLGFEISNGRVNAFVPGMAGGKVLDSSLYSVFANGNVVEFALSNSLFTTPIAGLTYTSGQTFPGAGDQVTLRLSQAFGYSVAGGATYGADRLGSVTIVGNATGAVPEPASWAMMLLGVGALGFVMRRQRRQGMRPVSA